MREVSQYWFEALRLAVQNWLTNHNAPNQRNKILSGQVSLSDRANIY